MTHRTASSILGAALAVLAFAGLSKETNDERYAFAPCPYATNELTKALSHFWSTEVLSKSRQILSRVFRLLPRAQGDKNDSIKTTERGSRAVLKQLNISPA